METLIKKSPAKINLGLYVLDKRTDEFHNIQTIFYPLLLSDELTFERSDRLELTSNSDQVNRLKSNIIQKAIKLVEEKTGENIALKIFIDKSLERFDVTYAAAGTANTAVPITLDQLVMITGGEVVDFM